MMTQNEAYEAIAKLAVLNKDEVKRVFDAFALLVKKEVSAGRMVYIAKIGKFDQVIRKAKTLHHPQTGEMINIPQRNALRFKLWGGFEKMRKGQFDGWDSKDF
jgi:DNA-binding protein HU-beta